MTSSGQLTKFACIVMICMVLSTHHAQAITCNDVVRYLLPCLGYLRGGGAVPGPCCGGVRGLNSAARTTPDRRVTCGCLKQAATAFRLGYGFASSLPGKCGVSIPYKIDPSTDKFACIVMICMVLSTRHAQAITRNDVMRYLLPCLGYLRDGGAVPGPCCGGVRGLNSAARTTPDRQAACGCIKQAATAFRLGYGYASSLPGKCGVSIPYQIGPSVDSKE